jgi:hypothetical protein
MARSPDRATSRSFARAAGATALRWGYGAKRRAAAGGYPRLEIVLQDANAPWRQLDFGRPFTDGAQPVKGAPGEARPLRHAVKG